VNTIQLAAFDAVHVQSRAAAIVTVPEPPDAGSVSGEFVTVTAQRTIDGNVCDVSEEVQAAIAASAAATSGNAMRGAVAPRPVRNLQSSSMLIRCTRAQAVQVAYLRRIGSGWRLSSV
jgi:hypothetical protein